MNLLKKPLLKFLNYKLDQELDKPQEQHEFNKVRLLIDFIAYLDEPKITLDEYLERSMPFAKKMQELNQTEEKEN